MILCNSLQATKGIVMGKRMYWGLIAIMAGQLAMANPELASALKQTAAPSHEYVRTPSRYIFKKLSDAAHRSGQPALSSFTIKNELAGSGDVKVSINLNGMTLFEAIQAVAEASGAGAEFQDKCVVLKNPDDVVALAEMEEAAPEPIAWKPEVKEKSATKRTEDVAPRISFSDVSHALVFVENGDSRGSGFIAEMDGVNYVFSNQHNFLGAKRINLKTMNGTYLKPVSFEYSRTHDIVRLRLAPEDVEELTVLKINFGSPLIHDEIVIYGNSAGGGVATELEGEVIGVGPADIEITAKMVPGNSGSPILNHDAEVVGVATYATLGQDFQKGSAYEKAFKGTRFNKVRRYGIRVPDAGWISDSMVFYLRQTYQLADMKTYILAVYTLHQYWQGNSAHAAMATRMITAYGGIAHSGEPPFDFKTKEWEDMLRKVVRIFKMNHEDLSDSNGNLSSGQGTDAVERLKRILREGVEQVQVSAEKTHWKSNLLKQEARGIKEMADEIINQIEESRNPYGNTNRRNR